MLPSDATRWRGAATVASAQQAPLAMLTKYIAADRYTIASVRLGVKAAGTVNRAAPIRPTQIGHLRLVIGAMPRAIRPSATKPLDSIPSVPKREGTDTSQPVCAMVT